jgi:hypothetical protein
MKRSKYLPAAIGIALGASLLTSCVKNEYYTPDPVNNNNNNNNNNNYYVFNEEFSNDNRGWAFSSSADSAYASVINGTLEFINYSTQASNTQIVETNMDIVRDFLIESRIRSDNDMGIIFGNSGDHYEYGYSFIINNGGYFIVYKEGNASTQVEVLKGWTQNTAITNNWNKVTIEQRNNYWIFTVNGYEVYQMPARPINGSYVGFITLPQTEGYADYLTVTSY